MKRSALWKMAAQKGMLLKDLAAKVGVADSHISNINSGRVAPSFDVLVALKNALGCTYDELMAALTEKEE